MRTVFAATVERPEGGYVLISVEDLCRAWSAYREKKIELLDLRAWFGCHEMLARRCTLKKDRSPNYSLGELHSLIGGAGTNLQSVVNRLVCAGLIDWSASCLHCTSDEVLSETAERMLSSIRNNRRRVPVPRRILRYLSLCATRATAATILGHLLRCVYFRSGGCTCEGTCKASWIASVFSVDERNVKSARTLFKRLGLFIVSSVAQWRLNRFGAVVRVNLSWAPGEREPIETPPLEAQNDTSSPPLVSNKKLLSEYKNQKPNSIWFSKRRGSSTASSPSLGDIKSADLSDAVRTLELFKQAVCSGKTQPGEAAELQFVAAAAHAERVATRNPCGLFATIIRRGLWSFVSQEDEDVALVRLKKSEQHVALSRRRNTAANSARQIGDTAPGTIFSVLKSLRLISSR